METKRARGGTAGGGKNWRERRPIPPDFRETAPLHTVGELRKIYRCGNEAVSRWSDESGVDYKGRKRSTPVPPDFRETAPLHTKRELIEIYRRSLTTINRWIEASGAKVKRVKAPAPKRDPMIEIRICTNCPSPVCRPNGCAILAAAFAALDAEAAAGREKPGIDSIRAAAL